MRFLRNIIFHPASILFILLLGIYYQFFLFGKVPFPSDTLVGAYYPWLDYKWGYPAGVPVKNALISDAFSQFLPWRYQVVNYLSQGIFPFWNPLSFSGTPIFATYHSAVFQPFNMLFLLPNYWDWGLFIFGQTLMAAWGIYFYLAGHIKKNWPKIASAFVFSFSGLMTTWVEYGTGVWAAACIPWILGSIDRYLKTKKTRWLFLLNFSFLTLYFSGHAQLTTYSSILFICYLVLKYLEIKNIKLFYLPMLFWLSTLLIFAIQYLPTDEHLKQSIRSSEAFSSSINFGLNKYYEIVRLFAADFFGNPTTGNYWDNIYYAEQSSFLGALTIPLIFPFLYKKFRNPLISFWGATFLISIFLAIESPITKWLYSQPLPLLTYSSASRIFFVMSLAAGILVGMSLDRLNDESFRAAVKKGVIYLLSVILGILLGLGFIYFTISVAINQDELSTFVKNGFVTVKNLIIPFGLLAVTWTILQLNLKNKIFLLTFLFIFDLSRYFWKHTPFVPQQIVFPTTPVIEFLQNQSGQFRIARADSEVFPPNTWSFYNIQSIEGYDPMALEDYAKLFNVIDKRKSNSGIDRFMELTNYPSNFIDALNVKYLVAVKRKENGEIGGDSFNYKIKQTNYRKIFEDKTTAVLENPDAKERTYFVNKIFPVKSKTEMFEQLEQTSFNPTTEAVVLGEVANEKLNIGKVQITQYSPNRVVLKTENPGKGFLVVADVYTKDWKLRNLTSRTPLKLYQVNGALRGFYTETGVNEYEMFYSPQIFQTGMLIALSGVVLTTMLFFYSVVKKII